MRDSAYASTIFSCIALYGGALESRGHAPSSSRHLLVASAAGATATVITFPLDVLRTRLAAGALHTSHAEVVRQLFRTEGMVRCALPARSLRVLGGIL